MKSTVQLESIAVQLPSKIRCFLVEFGELSRVRSTESSGFMERAMGIEPTSEAWEALRSKFAVFTFVGLWVVRQYRFTCSLHTSKFPIVNSATRLVENVPDSPSHLQASVLG